MNKFLFLFLLCIQCAFGNEIYWGKTGHRVVAEVASQHLSSRAKRKIKKILNGNWMVLVATHADDIKSDPRFKEYSPWHYVNFDDDKRYGEVAPNPRGDLVTGIDHCIRVLKNPESSEEDQSFFLKLLIHLIGDVHQPLHVGRAADRGGNDIQVQWFKEGSNLHRVWDEDMINFYLMSYTELANSLPVASKKQIREIQSGNPIDWIYESKDLSKQIYASVKTGEQLRYKYMYQHFDTVRMQLQKGGLRLAKLLNGIFG